MDSPETTTVDVCLNCGSTSVENFCANCGQKAQPTKLPFRVFLKDAAETLFNIDNRVFRSLRDLFRYPGKLTREYVEGHRATYLPPLRIYISISVIYFLLAQVIDSHKILFVNFTLDDESEINLAKIIQTALFFLVPVLAGILKLLHRKRKAYYVEYLIFSMHIHSIWFVLFTFQLLVNYAGELLISETIPWLSTAMITFSEMFQILAMIYLVVSIRKVYQQKWIVVLLKSFAALFLYLLSLGVTTFLALLFF